jgi:MraZ protein
MVWLVGKYEHSLDDKGRITLPAKFRVYFEKIGYLSRHEDGCLALWTPAEFEVQAAKLKEQEATGDKQVRDQVRKWTASVVEIELDKQGRIQIPQPLREFAHLVDEVVVTGVMNRVEFWSKESWQQMEGLS